MKVVYDEETGDDIQLTTTYTAQSAVVSLSHTYDEYEGTREDNEVLISGAGYDSVNNRYILATNSTLNAEDTAGNSCAAVTRTWVVDTVAPTAPVISGKPAALTNTPAFAMSAASDDATALTYHWTFNGVGTVGASLADNAREGANSVSVYATDEAGNVSATTSYSWTLDTTAPSGLAIGGTPAQGATTANSAASLTAISAL